MFGKSRKDQLFYETFSEHAATTRDAAAKFTQLLGANGEAEQLAGAIRADKKRGGELLRKTVRELHATWITPLDRHQIHDLAEGFDGVLGLIHSTATRVRGFALRDSRSEAHELAGCVDEACRKLCDATALLPKLSKDNHEIEGKSDELHQRALTKLFDGSTEPLEVMKWREIFDNLESATNLCRDVAIIFEAIVLENA
jgi:uncharacterized protein Yka (UPF0111/DUF47 family)